MAKQVKSKEHDAEQEYGEVFTNEREVNAMLDIVKQNVLAAVFRTRLWRRSFPKGNPAMQT